MQPFGRTTFRLTTLIALAIVFIARTSLAQVGAVTLTVEPDQVGLGGMMRHGGWTPVRLTLVNSFAQPLQVACRWIINDADGDVVLDQRVVTLSAQRTQSVWLYAAVPMAEVRQAHDWVIHVVDTHSGRLIASQVIAPTRTVPTTTKVVGVTSSLTLGLQGFGDEPYTHHERIEFLRGLAPAEMPDRWFGLSLLDELIWTPDAGTLGDKTAGDPNNPAISPETRSAIIEWVRRGGHLVIVMPGIGEPWSTSPFKELLGHVQTHTVTDATPPAWLGEPLSDTTLKVDMKIFDPGDDPVTAAAVLLSDEQGRPLVVVRQHGLGCVTLLGVDVTDPRYVRMGLPSGRVGLWHHVFHWRGPVFTKRYIEAELKNSHLINPALRRYVPIDDFLRVKLAMRETAVVPLTLAAMFFISYWFFAGPVGFMALKKRDLSRHNWALFAVVTAVCSVLAWGGAWLLRPSSAKIAHFSIVDIDAPTGLVHAHSWASVFVPRHGLVEMTLGDPDQVDNRNTIASVGVSENQDTSGFLDTQRYTVDSASPHRLVAPFRSTAKQVELDYLGRAETLTTRDGKKWGVPSGELKLVNGWPEGKLTHHLPGTLRDGLVIYQPADGREPWVWRLKEWPAGKAIDLRPLSQPDRLVIAPIKDSDPWNGYLGMLAAMKVGGEQQPAEKTPVLIPTDRLIRSIEVLSLFDTLPPPQFVFDEKEGGNGFLMGGMSPIAYRRAPGRPMDITRMLGLRRVIIIGHLEGGELPAPLDVDGRRLPAHRDSWTVVRWISPVLD
ncbi:MAG: hypothetical protein K8S99_18715 [Planctomycetes bacterium]|nr:hypothetical protein [Planctomycetota bacterium]